MGEQTDPQMKGLKDNYKELRGKHVDVGMEKTVVNVKNAAEGSS